MSIVQGKDLMMFIKSDDKYKTIAMATNTSLSIVRAVSETSHKDAGCWGEAVPGKISWSGSSNSFVGEKEDLGLYHKDLFRLMQSKEPVDMHFTTTDRKDCAPVSGDGWQPKANTGYVGKIFITQVDYDAPDEGEATLSVNYTGTGQLKEASDEGTV